MENTAQEPVAVSNYQRPKFIKWFYIINILLLSAITFIPLIIVFAQINVGGIVFVKIFHVVISIKYWLIPTEFSVVVILLLCELILFIKKQKNNLASALLFFCVQVILIYFVMFLFSEVFGTNGNEGIPTPALPVAPRVY